MPRIRDRVDELRLLGRPCCHCRRCCDRWRGGGRLGLRPVEDQPDGHGGRTRPVSRLIGTWAVMMAAMMLPSAVPVVARSASLNRSPALGLITTPALVGIYLLAWTAFGVAAYFVYDAIVSIGQANSSWLRGGVLLTGIAIACAGLYGLTPLKRSCQARCRALASNGWEPEGGMLRRVVRTGANYSVNCVGSSVGLMVALLAVGLTSITWMVIVSAIVLVHKVVLLGHRIDDAMAVALVACGAWVAIVAGAGAMLTAVP